MTTLCTRLAILPRLVTLCRRVLSLSHLVVCLVCVEICVNLGYPVVE